MEEREKLLIKNWIKNGEITKGKENYLMNGFGSLAKDRKNNWSYINIFLVIFKEVSKVNEIINLEMFFDEII